MLRSRQEGNPMDADKQARGISIHPLVVRITHWINALAILIMVTSGWRIYDASPIFHFRFPPEITLGGWLAGALQWHFAAMWLLAANGLVYLCYGIFSGHFRKKFWPIAPAAVIADILAAFKGKLAHDDLTVYNAAQRAAYATMILTIIVLVLSGLAIWKPVQLQGLAALLGGYEGARRVHFFAMTITVFIVIVHVAMVALVPKTFPTMITGRLRSGS
jgi:thiosulfate reductase cytochrome b subunit